MQKKRILLLNNRVPFPVKDGGALATSAMIKSLIALGYVVDLFFLNTKKHYSSIAETQKAFAENTVYQVDIDTSLKTWNAVKAILAHQSYNIIRFDKAEAHQALSNILLKNKYDAIHFESVYTAPYLKTVRKYSNAKCVLRTHNLEHEIWRKIPATNVLKKMYLRYLASRLESYETLVMTQFDAIMPISQSDANWIKAQSVKNVIKVIATPVYIAENLNIKQGKCVFHLGSMEWMPNQLGVQYLVEEVWPLVQAKDPEIQLHLAGKGMGDDFIKWHRNHVFVHGEVENAATFMQQYNIMVIPLKSASGLRIKAIEAMGLGLPIISTTLGMSGIEAEEGKNCILADDKLIMAAKIVELANDFDSQQSLGSSAWQFAKEKYSNSAISSALNQFYQTIFAP